jgi:predicted N-acetyltransferase YhbS
MLTFNPLSVSDALDLQAFRSELSEEFSWVGKVQGDPEQFVRALLLAKNDLTIVARDNGKMVGYLYASFHLSVPRLDMLLVSETYRGQGLGTRLVAQAEDFAKATRCPGMYLFCDSESEQLHAYYKRLGFYHDLNGSGENFSCFRKKYNYDKELQHV